MSYRLLADLTLLLHLAFILFVLLGGLLCLYRGWLAWLHLPAVAWGIWVEWSGTTCPLTPLENHYRRLASGLDYTGGFIEHYLHQIIYPDHLTDTLQWFLGSLVLFINFLIYAFIYRRKILNRVDE